MNNTDPACHRVTGFVFVEQPMDEHEHLLCVERIKELEQYAKEHGGEQQPLRVPIIYGENPEKP